LSEKARFFRGIPAFRRVARKVAEISGVFQGGQAETIWKPQRALLQSLLAQLRSMAKSCPANGGSSPRASNPLNTR
jgi:hypothetical protein